MLITSEDALKAMKQQFLQELLEGDTAPVLRGLVIVAGLGLEAAKLAGTTTFVARYLAIEALFTATEQKCFPAKVEVALNQPPTDVTPEQPAPLIIATTPLEAPTAPAPIMPVAVRRRQDLYSVMNESWAMRDISTLAKLYRFDYVDVHMQLWQDVEGLQGVDVEAWEQALGVVDFPKVLEDISSSRTPVRGTRSVPKKLAKGCAEPIVGLLKCVEREKATTQRAGTNTIIGYLLYELREKGSASKRQRYCEIVNIVVAASHRGHGAGRLLYQGLESKLQAAHPEHAKDIRLFVAERNEAPRAWYLRLGFKPSGWQVETLRGCELKFVRMIKQH